MKAHQRGVAIVLAMGVVALAALEATAIMTSQSAWVRRSELAADHAQALVLVQAGVDWSRAVLGDDRRVSSVDHPGEAWALRLPPIPVDNGELKGYLEDQQGAFNLNNMVKNGKIDPAQLAAFRRLLSILDLPATLADALADWLDADNLPQPQGGAEDGYYLANPTPYLAANQPLADVAELALVRGYDESVRARLRPFVTALPRFTAVNVNTARPEVLAATIEGLDIDSARSLTAQRERTYFRDKAGFLDRLPGGIVAVEDNISVSSDYFLATVQVGYGSATAHGKALLGRESADWPIIVWRKYL